MHPKNSNSFLFNFTLARRLCFVICILLYIPIISAQRANRKQLVEKIQEIKSDPSFKSTDTVYISQLLELGQEMRFYDVDSSLVLSKQALDLSKKAGYLLGESEAYFGIGNYYSDKGMRSAAINNYTKADILANKVNNINLSLRILNNLATEYAYKGDYAKALNNYLEGIELAELHDEKLRLSIFNENIAGLYSAQKDYPQALEYYKKVKKINDELADEVNSAETTSNLASLYADMGKLDYAMFNINRSIATFEKHRVLDWLAFTYEIKGKIYLKQDKFQWALYWYRQAELLHEELDDNRGKIDLYNGMAEAYLGQEKDSLSHQYAINAYEISKKIKFLEGTHKCARTLYNISKYREDYKQALAYHEIYQQLTDTLHRNENKQSLTLLKTRSEYDQQKTALIEKNEKAMAKQRALIYTAVVVFMIFAVIMYLVKKAERIQKRMNKELQAKTEKLEAQEAALTESNETKTKLFSIIGHDLRGPIGALQGLLQMFADGEIKKSEFFEFVPKLRSDVDHIFFTLNNLLTWGNSQMNGATTKPSVVPLESLVDDNINLLSEIAKNKSIKVINEIGSNTVVWSDSNQIDIVVRNLISNALKFTPENGMITIKARESSDTWEISILDTGVGMDKMTIERIFKKDSNLTTYGTNNEKGTGLGLSLCKEMVENNGGKIWVESALRKGSIFYFTLPKAQNKYSQAS